MSLSDAERLAMFEARAAKHVACTIAWREKNPERNKEYQRSYYFANKEKLAENNRRNARIRAEKKRAAAAPPPTNL